MVVSFENAARRSLPSNFKLEALVERWAVLAIDRFAISVVTVNRVLRKWHEVNRHDLDPDVQIFGRLRFGT